jgi:16S rRNA (guanine527-N7)-methyltransferase
MELETRLLDGLQKMAIPDGESLSRQLMIYLGELSQWNRTFNLTAIRDPIDMVARHLLDSLAILPWVSGERLLDVGSGAGLPGIPLALAQPQREYFLLDSNGKKVNFLRHVIRKLNLDRVEAVQARVEHYQPEQAFDCITARAFAAVDQLARVSEHLLAPGGLILAMRGRDEPVELPANFRLRDNQVLNVPGLDAQRHLMIIERVI